jgi:hypothetical protein
MRNPLKLAAPIRGAKVGGSQQVDADCLKPLFRRDKFLGVSHPKPPPKSLHHPRCARCEGKGWVPRHGGLRKRPCDFCGGKGFKIPKKTLAKLTGRHP